MTVYRSCVWANGEAESPLALKEKINDYLDNNSKRIGFFPNISGNHAVYHKEGISIILEYKQVNIGKQGILFLGIDFVSEVAPVEGLAKIVKDLSPELKISSQVFE